MAKCNRCDKGIGLLRQGLNLRGGCLCKSCLRELGFDDKADQYLLATCAYDDIREGKARYNRLRSARSDAHYDFVVHYDDEKIDRYLEKYQKDWSDPDYKYRGLSIRDIKEQALYGEKIYKYEPLDVDLSFVYQDGLLQVLLFDGKRDVNVGYAPKTKAKRIRKILEEYDPAVTAELSGGHYYKLKDNGYVEDEMVDDLKIRVNLDWSGLISLDNVDAFTK